MHYVHSNRMFETANSYQVEVNRDEQAEVNNHEFRHNFATFAGGLLTGAVLAVAGTMAVYTYERAMEPAPATAEAVQVQTQSNEATGFSVGAQVKQN